MGKQDWHPINIHNLYQRNHGPLKDSFDFSRSRDSLYKILGRCKAALREYWMPTMKDHYVRFLSLLSAFPVLLGVFFGLGVGEGRAGKVVVQLRGVLPSASLRPSPSFFLAPYRARSAFPHRGGVFASREKT